MIKFDVIWLICNTLLLNNGLKKIVELVEMAKSLFFKKLSSVFNGKKKIEKIAREELNSHSLVLNYSNEFNELPSPIKEVMQRNDAHGICKEILKLPLNWMPPKTSEDPKYIEHSTFKSHVELLGPDGLVKSSVIRLGFYGMLPNASYGTRTHPADELYIMLAGNCFWQKGGEDYIQLRPKESVYHPSLVPHASLTKADAFMSVYVWYGNLSKNEYKYRGIE